MSSGHASSPVAARIPWLDVCRALAILLVLISHGRHFLIPLIPQAQLLKFGGFMGVELFFVLSGFLVGGILIESLNNASHRARWIPRFWARRWLRTVPSYLLFVVINYLLIGNIRQAAEPNLMAYLTFTQNLAWPHPPFFGEAWSLAVEEIFYFLTPLLIVCFLGVLKDKSRAVLAAAALIFACSLLARAAVVMMSDPAFDEGVRKISLLRLDALMTGVFLAWMFAHPGISDTVIRRIGIALVPLFFLAVYVASMPDAWLDSMAVIKILFFNVTSLGCLGLIVVGYKCQLPSLIGRPIAAVARWSYAAYLTNLPVFACMLSILGLPKTPAECILYWLLFMSLSLLSAYLVYALFERRILLLRDRMG